MLHDSQQCHHHPITRRQSLSLTPQSNTRRHPLLGSQQSKTRPNVSNTFRQYITVKWSLLSELGPQPYHPVYNHHLLTI